MKGRRHIAWVGVLFVALHAIATGDVVLETRRLRLRIGDDGTVRSLTAKPSGEEHAWLKEPTAAFVVQREKREFPASSVAVVGDELVVRFATAGVTAKFDVIRAAEYVALKLVSLEGGAIDHIRLLQLPVKTPPYLGRWVNVAYSDTFGICLCAGNIKTNAGMRQHKGHVVLSATASREVGLEGATAVLFGCLDPKEKFLEVMEVVERDFKMPAGARHRRSPIQKYSYLWVRPTPGDIHEYIRWAKRGGFRMILFSYTAFTKGVGHFAWNARYPNGMADLKKVTRAIREAGLALGLHLHYNKALKSDPYVTPVPDDRLHKVRSFTLAAAVDAKAGTIVVRENPKGCTMDDGRRILKAGKELIAYKDYTATPPFQFRGCERGHLKSQPAAHRAGDAIGLLNVDTWNIFIRFDQNTDIQDEAARRIAAIFRDTGPYDMVYFDGAEDVHAPFWYHCANAQHRVFRHFQPEPPVCEAAANTHFSWHMISRSNAYDSVAPSEMKAFCRKSPCRGAAARALDFTRVNFGWLHGFARSGQSYITPDILEYVLSRGAAWDCPFSMTVNLRELAQNPRTEDCFDVIKTWEDARIEGKLTAAHREQLKKLDQEHHLLLNEKGEHELVAIHEVPNVAGGRAFQAYTFRRESRPEDTYVLIGAVADDADIFLPVPPGRLKVMRPFGRPLAVKTERGKTVVPIGNRRYLVFVGMGVERVVQVLAEAKSSAGKPTALYRPAAKFAAKVGRMALTSETGTKPPGAMGDCIVPSGAAALGKQEHGHVDYQFTVPYKGRWALWGRMRYRDTGSNSFFAGLADKPETKQRFGNSYVWGTWLWDGGPVFQVGPGEVTIRVYIREAAPRVSPLLDVLCLTNDPGYRPTDADAAKDPKTR